MTEIIDSIIKSTKEASWVVVGNFDGVHLGHQALIRSVISKAHETGSRSVLITFNPHTRSFLDKASEPFLLNTLSERLEQISHLDIDLVVVQPFDAECASLDGEQFLLFLREQLGMVGLVTGKEFSLGRDRLGSEKSAWGRIMSYGISLERVEPKLVNGQVVSSGLIRENLVAGNIMHVNQMLGREYQLSGIVGHGKERGSALDLPTANIQVDSGKLLPGFGVYACLGWVNGKPYPAVTNIGIRPTFDSDNIPSVEAHFLEYSGDLYEKRVSLSFFARIRDEHKFENKEALLAQVSKDKQEARRILHHAI